MYHCWSFFSVNLFCKTDIPTFDKPIGGSVVAIIWQKIVIELPKYVESNASYDIEKLFKKTFPENMIISNPWMSP